MKVDRTDDGLVLRLTPDDLSRTQEALEAVTGLLETENDRRLIADLAQVPDLTSLQAGTLFVLHQLCYENVALLKLANADPKVKLVLRLLGLDRVMEAHHGREVVLESFGPHQGEPPVTEGRPPGRS